MSKQFWIALVAIAVILGGILFVSNHGKNSSSSGSTGQPSQHVEGKNAKGVTLVEYGDFECPACGAFEPTVEQVRQKYSNDIAFQFRNLPLVQIHQNAFAGARAAEAAALQNKYWEMHDMLYANQKAWEKSSNPQGIFDTYAKSLGLNLTQFDQDYQSEKVNGTINADLDAFKKTGDDMATPTFYLDGQKLDNTKLVDASGRPNLDAFSKFIDAEIAKKNP